MKIKTVKVNKVKDEYTVIYESGYSRKYSSSTVPYSAINFILRIEKKAVERRLANENTK